MKDNKILLWLDDQRNPFLDKESKVPLCDCTIVWARNYNEFVEWVLVNGLPRWVSFDHDLAPEHYTPEFFWDKYELSEAYQKEQTYKEGTGRDCAEYMVYYCRQMMLKFPTYFVHSANPVGAKWIIEEIKNNT
jgi:hypothetical protein